MKESIGATQLFIIVITLVLLFSGIMAMTIKRSNAFAIKDSMITIIEENGGFDTSSGSIFKDLLKEQAYRQTGVCPKGSWGYDRNGNQTSGNNKSAFCITRTEGSNGAGSIRKYYYTVQLFYTLDLPVIKDSFNFKVTGITKALYK